MRKFILIFLIMYLKVINNTEKKFEMFENYDFNNFVSLQYDENEIYIIYTKL